MIKKLPKWISEGLSDALAIVAFILTQYAALSLAEHLTG